MLPALLALLCLPALGASAQPRPKLIIGESLPDLALPRLEGGKLALRGLRGQPVAISFFSRYCEPCRRELPTLQRVLARLNRELPAKRQVLGVVISLDSADETRAQARLAPSMRWLLDPDGHARAQFDPRTFPCTFLADATSRVRHINRGFGCAACSAGRRDQKPQAADPPAFTRPETYSQR